MCPAWPAGRLLVCLRCLLGGGLRLPSPVQVRMILDKPAHPRQIFLAHRSAMHDLRMNHANTLRACPEEV
jgi:hypothetical protein